MLVSLDALGWRVTEIRPTGDRDAPLWHVKIERVDFVASMTAMAPDPDVALEELVRYAAADADELGEDRDSSTEPPSTGAV